MSIQEKYEFLLAYEHLNVIQIAEDFGIKKSQAYNIINSKDKIINDFKAIENIAESKRTYAHRFKEIDDKTSTWFLLQRQRNAPLSGEVIKEKALQIASELSINDFKAFNGWLENFKTDIEFQLKSSTVK